VRFVADFEEDLRFELERRFRDAVTAHQEMHECFKNGYTF